MALLTVSARARPRLELSVGVEEGAKDLRNQRLRIHGVAVNVFVVARVALEAAFRSPASVTRTCRERSGFAMRASFISDLHQWSLGMDCSEGREESQQMYNAQSGASCQSTSQQASGLPLAADRVQDRRQREVQRDYGVSDGTDQKS